MDPTHIAELLQPFLPQANDQRLTANDGLYQNISTYIDILLRWNARINLTAIRDPDEIVTRHFGESLFTARHLFPAGSHVGTAAQACPERSRRGCPAERSFVPPLHSAASGEASPAPSVRSRAEELAKEKEAPAPGSAANDQRPLQPCDERGEGSNDRPRLADVGSGAGFPGIPIKLWNPRIHLTLIEANQKKATFLREAARALTLTDIDIFNGRAEDLAAGQPGFEVVTLRAVERFEDALRVSAALLIPGGRLALLAGSSQQDDDARLLPFFTWSAPLLIPMSRSRMLLLGNSPEL